MNNEQVPKYTTDNYPFSPSDLNLNYVCMCVMYEQQSKLLIQGLIRARKLLWLLLS